MKRHAMLLILVFCIVAGTDLYATKWRVNNTGLPADFTYPHVALSSPLVLEGDTLMIESSILNYGNVDNLNKRLVIIGPGYFLGENDSTQADKKPAIIRNVSFGAGSSGSVIKGISITENCNVSNASADMITLERNNINNLNVSAGSSHVIIQNYIRTATLANANNVLISNNIFWVTSTHPSLYTLGMDNNSAATIENNVFAGYIVVRNSLLRNNILADALAPEYFSAANCWMEYNISALTQFGNENGNQQNVDMSTVFMNTGSTDGKWQLKAGSPAIGAGAGGVDCGAYDGNYPYVLSGMVAGPSVWHLNMIGTDVTVKAKSH